MAEFKNLLTPDQFVNYYYNELQNILNADNIQLSKTGMIGFFLQLLGNLQFDIKYYYDYLFAESFVSTATDTKNLYLHALTHSFNPYFARSSKLNGELSFNFDTLPSFNTNLYRKREIFLENLKIKIDDMVYQSENTRYIINIENINNNKVYSVDIIDEENRKERISISENNPVVYLKDFYQFEKDEIFFTTPNYSLGSYYSYNITLNDDEFLESIKVYIENTEDQMEEYEVSFLKEYNQNNKVVFLRMIDKNQYILDFGNGYKGFHVPNSDIRIELRKVYGAKANINKQISKNISGFGTFFDYPKNENYNTIQQKLNVQDLADVKVLMGEGGQDILYGKELKEKLLDYIQSRVNLINKNDFDNLISPYFKYSEILFKKYDLFDNVITVYINYEDRLNNPIYTKTLNIKNDLLDSQKNINYIFNPEIDVNNKKFISPFMYKYDDVFNSYIAYVIKKEADFYSNYHTIRYENEFNQIKSDNNYSMDNFLNNVINVNTEKLSVNNIYTPPSIHLNLSFDHLNEKTIINIVSFENIVEFYEMFIDSGQLNINSEQMDYDEDNLLIYYYEYDGIIENEASVTITISIKVLDIDDDRTIRSENFYTVTFNNIIQAVYSPELIFLRNSKEPFTNDDYIINVPFIDKDIYYTDELHYNNLIYNSLMNFDIDYKYNRMISDDVQIRFLNTYNVKKEYLSKITYQKYNFDLYLPLILKVDIIINDVTIDVNKNINRLKMEIAKFLNSYKTNINISFYTSEIVDLIHNYDWVKFTKVEAYDSNNNLVNNIEIYDQYNYYKKLDKKSAFHFNPVLFWWDINNIIINYQFRE